MIVTTVHPLSDVRILYREAKTLSRANYDIEVFGVGPLPQDPVVGIELTPLLQARNRAIRMAVTGPHLILSLVRRRADAYHFHDPELLSVAVLLRALGRRVIYDAHEDLPAQILDKEWIARPLRRPAAWIADKAERRLARSLSGVIAATEAIARRFPEAVVVHNYPDLDAFPAAAARERDGCTHLAYIGGLSPMRGGAEMVAAMARVREPKASLHVIGAVQSACFGDELEAMRGHERVIYHGHQPWRDAWRWVAENADIGLLLYQPARNHVEALPTKLFEYMAAGLPVIASDFPLWREIVEGAGAGLLVDPRDPRAIAAAIDRLAADPELRRTMGQRARRAAVERYNWAPEAERLLALYREVLSEDH